MASDYEGLPKVLNLQQTYNTKAAAQQMEYYRSMSKIIHDLLALSERKQDQKMLNKMSP